MTEEQTEYEKTITATEMLNITSGASHQKIMENNHKKNILDNDTEYLFKRLNEERAEFNKAFRIWQGNPTPKNAVEVLREWADCNNFGSAIVMKTDGYTELTRE